MKWLLAMILLAVGWAIGGYWAWSETGPYEWWANLLMRPDHSYSRNAASLWAMGTALIPISLFMRLALGLHKYSVYPRWVGFVGIFATCAIAVGIFLHGLLAEPVPLTGDFKRMFSEATLLPQEFVATARQLPPLQPQLAAGVVEKFLGPRHADLYVPFDSQYWPEPSTPAILKIRQNPMAPSSDSTETTYFFVRRPVPLLVRQQWKAPQITEAIVVTDQSPTLDFWLTAWVGVIVMFYLSVKNVRLPR